MKLYVNGGRKLTGELDITAAKNAVLPIIAGCLLSKKTVTIKNCPPLLDIYAMLDILKSTGAQADFDGGVITVNCSESAASRIDENLTKPMRASVFILGPLLSRFKRAEISYPGGCEIGSRPIDIHLDGLRALGAKVDTQCGIISCSGENMRAATIDLSLPSVGATENLMMAAVLLPGTTVINNAAKEPEIEDLADFINSLGGKISGAGTSTVFIEGVSELNGGEYTPIPDRIVAGTYLTACAIAGGKIKLNNVNHNHIYSAIDKLQAAGCRFSYKKNALTIASSGEINAVSKTSTMPYPGFPTDLQPQLVALLSAARGKSIVIENVFESRFKYVSQLKKMGADIEVIGTRAVITGVPYLKGTQVESPDLRGGAALVLAGLRASGQTQIGGVEHIDRGYYKIEEDLKQLNADITRKI